MPLITSAVRFVRKVDRCLSTDEVIAALHEHVRPFVNVLGAWFITLDARRGGRRHYPVYSHPDVAPLIADYWPMFEQHGPSVLARRAWRTRRDFRMSDVLHEHPEPDDLWIFDLLHKHGIRDIVYIAVLDYWHVVFWSPHALRLDKTTWRALRIAADAAVRRIEELDGIRSDGDPKLTTRERDVLRLLRDDKPEREVAKLLNISPASVKQYVARSKRKLRTIGLRDTFAKEVSKG